MHIQGKPRGLGALKHQGARRSRKRVNRCGVYGGHGRVMGARCAYKRVLKVPVAIEVPDGGRLLQIGAFGGKLCCHLERQIASCRASKEHVTVAAKLGKLVLD